MSGDDYVLALLDKRQNLLMVVGPDSLRGELQTFTSGRGDVVAPAPDVDLFVAPLLPSVVLVETAELAIVALVESLVFVHGDVLLPNLLELDSERSLRALESRGERNVELDTSSLDALSAGKGFLASKLGKSGVFPAGEEVELVPFGLPVTGEDECANHFGDIFIKRRGRER